jgi:hypothetical protein
VARYACGICAPALKLPNQELAEGAIVVASGPDIPAQQLQAMVRERIEQGRLPVVVDPYVKAGYGGFGANCEVCAREIQKHDAEYQVPNANGSFLFHLRCHHAWQAECVRLQSKKR